MGIIHSCLFDNQKLEPNQYNKIKTSLIYEQIRCYDVEFVNNIYIAQPSDNSNLPMVAIRYKSEHSEKMQYYHDKLMRIYGDVQHEHSRMSYKYKFQSLYIMHEFAKKIVKYLNGTYTMCRGCNTNFICMKDCIDHKKSCAELWKISKVLHMIFCDQYNLSYK